MELHQSFTNYRYQLEQTLDKLLALGTKNKEIIIELSEEDYIRLCDDFAFTKTYFTMYPSEVEDSGIWNGEDCPKVQKYKFGPLTVFFKTV